MLKKLTLLVVIFNLIGCSKSPESNSQIDSEHANKKAKLASSDLYADYLNRPVTDDIFYFVMPDRFANGDLSNDEGSLTQPESHGGFKPHDKGYFHGGDLAGLTEKLDYIKNLGATAVWLTPVLRNQAVQGDSSAYHGYWILDFTQIDPHLGSNAELNKLIDTAHSMGMKVFFDIIVNHTADVISYRECHNDDGSFIDPDSVLCPFKTYDQITSGDQYSPFIADGREALKKPNWLNDVQYYNNRGDSIWQGESVITGDFVGLDDFDTADPRVVDGMIDIYKNIISEFKPDGLRIDTVKHVEMSFWQKFSPAIMQHAHDQGLPQFHVFGEVAQGDAAFLSRYSSLGQLPATLDFQHFYSTNDVFVGGKSVKKLEALVLDDDYYNDADTTAKQKMTFVSNHDNGRIGYFLTRDQSNSEEQERLQRTLLGHAYMYFSTGIPVIYYGDEQGFTGDGNDKDAREDMMPSLVASYNDNNLIGTDKTTAEDNFDEQHPIYRALASFAELYKAHPALRDGAQHIRVVDEEKGIFAFSRIASDDLYDYLLVFNTSLVTQEITISAISSAYTPLYGATQDLIPQERVASLQVPALSFVMYRSEQPLPAVDDLTLTLESANNDLRSPMFVDVKFNAAVEDNNHSLPLLHLAVEAKTSDGNYVLIGSDDNAPFGIKLPRKFLNDEKATLRATVENLVGKSQRFEFEIDVK
jgi:glycosidase